MNRIPLAWPDEPSKPSNIFLKFDPNGEIKNETDALAYLRDRAPIPILLRQVRKELGTCVEVETLGAPRFIFMVAPPSDEPRDDLAEIAEWFKESKLSMKLI